jgi:integrase
MGLPLFDVAQSCGSIYDVAPAGWTERVDKETDEMNLKATELVTLGDGMHSDGDYLWLKVRGAGRSWVVRGPRDENGKRQEAGLGSADRVSLALARKERDKLVEAWRNGLDPIAERRAAKEAAANRKTFVAVARLKIAAKQSEWRTSAEGATMSLDTWTRSVERDCAPIHNKAIDEVTVEDIKRIVSPYWDRGNLRTAHDLVKRIEVIFDYAFAHGWRTKPNPAAWAVFKELWPATKAKRPHAAVPWSDTPKFVRQLRTLDAVGARVVEFAILTASRSLEARGAKWSEIDLEAKTWTVPAARLKMGKKRPVDHVVPLSDQAVALLKRIKTDGDFIFPAYTDCGRREREASPIRHPSAWRVVKRIAGADVTMHGFRSTFRDWCGDHGIDRELAERSLAHKFGSEVEASYARSTLVARRAPIMQAWADFVDGREVATKVLPFKREAA